MVNIEEKLYGQYSKRKELMDFFKKKVNELYNKEDVTILVNSPNDLLPSPVITPIGNTNWITVNVFENNKEANEFILNSGLLNKIYPQVLSGNKFLFLLEKLFFKGVSGVLYSFGEDSLYIPTIELLKREKNSLLKETYLEIVRYLNTTLNKSEFLYYIYDDILTADEILYGIVKFKIENISNKKYIDIFTNRDLAEKFCMKNKIESKNNLCLSFTNEKCNKDVLNEIGADTTKENIPVTSIINNLLFHSLNINLKKVNLIRFHTNDKKYIIPIEDFLKLVVNIGFEQLDLR